MILLDTNIFVIDRFFPRDDRYSSNRNFIQRLPRIDACLSIFSLLELCGISSFNLSEKELKKWFFEFYDVYKVKIVNPIFGFPSTEEWFVNFVNDLFMCMQKRMVFGDAILLKEAESYKAKHIVTWNKKHFINRTQISIVTPDEFMECQK